MIEEHFVFRNEQSYAAFCGILSIAFTKSYVLQSDLRLVVYADEAMFVPFRKQPESAVDRIRFLFSKMAPTGYNVTLNIIRYKQGDGQINFPYDNKQVGLIHSVSQAWKIDAPIQPNWITCNISPGGKFRRQANIDGGRIITKEQIEKHIIPDVYVGYETPIELLYNALSHSKHHISYQGGSAWISILMGIKTTIVHNTGVSDRYYQWKKRCYGQDVGHINYFDGNEINYGRAHPMENHINIGELGEQKI